MEKVLFGTESNNCVGFCKLHCCSMTTKQMRKKECLKKQCYHLCKNDEHPYWHQRECIKAKRNARKQIMIGVM